jgi:hypothetical protein
MTPREEAELAELVDRTPIGRRREMRFPWAAEQRVSRAYAWTGVVGVSVSLWLFLFMLARLALS